MSMIRTLLLCTIITCSTFVNATETSRGRKQTIAKKNRSIIAQRGRRGRHGGRRRGRGGVRFRFYIGPRYGHYRRGYYYRGYGYYYYQVSISVKEDIQAGERILNASIDGYRINLRQPSPSGSRGSYSYRLNPGYHEISWTVEFPDGKTQRYNHSFYVDRYNRYTNILIDGDQIFIN